MNITQPELHTYLEEQVILPSVQQEVERLIKSKKIWLIVSAVTEVLSHICSAIASVLTFAAGFYKLELLSFLSGVINVISLLLLLFSKFSNEKHKHCIEQLQNIKIFNRIVRNNSSNNIY